MSSIYECKCGARYTMPKGSAGKQAKCKKCGAVFVVPDDDETYDLSPKDKAELEAEVRKVQTPPVVHVSETVNDRTGDGVAGEIVDATADVLGGRFWSDVFWSFLFISDPGNLASFIVVWAASIFVVMLSFAGCFGLIGAFFMAAYLAAFYLNTIVDTAGGEDQLPTVGVSNGIYDDWVMPFVQFIGTSALLMVPAMTMFYLNVFRGYSIPPFVIWTAVALGAFLWPISILAVSMGGLTALARIDVLIGSVLRTIVPYLAVWVLLLAVVALGSVVYMFLHGTLPGSLAKFAPKSKVAATVLVAGVVGYVTIVVMRIIGLYYRHFKRYFIWAME